jgi:hypothetical protein
MRKLSRPGWSGASGSSGTIQLPRPISRLVCFEGIDALDAHGAGPSRSRESRSRSFSPRAAQGTQPWLCISSLPAPKVYPTDPCWSPRTLTALSGVRVRHCLQFLRRRPCRESWESHTFDASRADVGHHGGHDGTVQRLEVSGQMGVAVTV